MYYVPSLTFKTVYRLLANNFSAYGDLFLALCDELGTLIGYSFTTISKNLK
jgi:hypothetical protein